MLRLFKYLTGDDEGDTPSRSPEGALTDDEKKAVKKLLDEGWRGQDILALVNIGRPTTTNSGRISAVKYDKKQQPYNDEELGRFLRVKQSYDLKTGLSPYTDERLCRAREAMLLAVQVYNSPTCQFKSELFAIISNVAWTYLCHERLEALGEQIRNEDGRSLSLSEMWANPKLALSGAIQANLSDIKELRDKVEHHLLERADVLWRSLFQANCLNFDRVMCEWFGEQLSFASELSFSLQFSKADLEQLKTLAHYDVPAEIQAFNEDLKRKKEEDVLSSAEYEFSVFYTFVPGSKSKAHVTFISPESEAGQEIANVLIKHKAGDFLYPYKPQEVVRLVKEKSGKKYSIHDHTLAWKRHKVRPAGVNPPSNRVNGKYCCYHPAHKDYTYNDAWVELLAAEMEKKA